jgi:hypothetical protein
MRTLMKSALERMLHTEMDVHLGRKAIAALPSADAAQVNGLAALPNRRNGHSAKTVCGDMGELKLVFDSAFLQLMSSHMVIKTRSRRGTMFCSSTAET